MVLAPERLQFQHDHVDAERGVGEATSARAGALCTIAALCSLGAGAIHLGYAPLHFSQLWSQGAFFAVAGWAQVAWGVGLLVRPSRRLLLVGSANLVVVALWVASRTVGIPLVRDGFEAAGYPDVLATLLEVALLVASALLVLRVRSRLLDPWRPSASALVAGTVLAAAVTVGFTPRFTAAHSAAGHAHGSAVAAGTGTTACERAGTLAAPAPGAAGQAHLHRGLTPQLPLDPATRSALAAQQELARGVVARFPTVQAAMGSGYRMSTPYIPCIGAHYTNIAYVAAFDPTTPSELLFDGTSPTSHLVGLSYLVYHRGGAPEGFAGPNDTWHQHNSNGGLCYNRSGVVIAPESASEGECRALSGRKRPLPDVWMLHDWVVPGMECTWGVFAAQCPELGGRTGGTAFDAPVKGAIIPLG